MTTRYRFALRLAGYNKPLYAFAVLVIVGGAALASANLPMPARAAGALVALGAAWYACASFLAFHWMFDRSGFLEGRWLQHEVTRSPARWLQINAGLEE